MSAPHQSHHWLVVVALVVRNSIISYNKVVHTCRAGLHCSSFMFCPPWFNIQKLHLLPETWGLVHLPELCLPPRSLQLNLAFKIISPHIRVLFMFFIFYINYIDCSLFLCPSRYIHVDFICKLIVKSYPL